MGPDGEGDDDAPDLLCCPLLSSPEELPRLRAEIEWLRARQVPADLREESLLRRVVVQEPLEGCLRQLSQARHGWEVLLGSHQQAASWQREKQKQLLGLLDLGLALLDRIEALTGKKKRRSGSHCFGSSPSATGGGGGEEEPPAQPLPTREETPGGDGEGGGNGRRGDPPEDYFGFPVDSPSLRGGGRGDQEQPLPPAQPLSPHQSPAVLLQEEEDDDDDDDDVEEENHPQLGDIRWDIVALEEEVHGLPGIPQEGHVSLLQERAKTLQGTLVKFAHRQVDQLDRLEFTLREALLYGTSSSPSLSKVLSRVPKEEVQGLQTFTWDFTRALWHFLQSHSDKDLPSKMTEAWKTEAKVLQEKIHAMKEDTLWGKQGRELWVEMDTPVQRMKNVLWETATMGMAAADLYRAMAVKATSSSSSSEEGLVALQERLAALRRGPLEEVDTMWQTQCRLESTLATLFMTQAIPQEEELLAMQKEATAMVDALNAISLEEVGSLPKKVGVFLGVGGKSSREILDLLGIPLMTMEALASSVDAVREDLFRLIESVEPVKFPQRKIRALTQSLKDLNCVLKASRREKVLQNLALDIPLKDLACLNKKLQVLSRFLQKREVVLKKCLLKKVDEFPDCDLEELNWLIPLPAWIPQSPELTSKAASTDHDTEQFLTFTGTVGISPQPGQDPGANEEESHSQISTPLCCIDSSASIQVTPQMVTPPSNTRPSSISTEMISDLEASLDPVAALAQGQETLSAPQKSHSGADEVSTGLIMKDHQYSLPPGLDDTSRLQSQDVQNSEETSDMVISDDILSSCSNVGNQVEISEPPDKRQKTEESESPLRTFLVQELFAAHNNYANNVTDTLKQVRGKMDRLMRGLLLPSNQPNRLKEAEEAKAMTATLRKALAHLKQLRGDS